MCEMDSKNRAVAKKALRKKILARRDALTQLERCEKSERIANQVVAMDEFVKSNIVLLYAPIKSEVDTDAIFQEAKRLGKSIYYPRVLGDRMEFYRVDEMTKFESGAYGICEPIPESTVVYEPSEKDCIIVVMPGAVFDMEGNRIGYGGGYYDRYLHWLEGRVSTANICKVAVAYKCQLVEHGMIQCEAHDIKVDYVTTE